MIVECMGSRMHGKYTSNDKLLVSNTYFHFKLCVLYSMLMCNLSSSCLQLLRAALACNFCWQLFVSNFCCTPMLLVVLGGY